jgi:hypothetical protein
VSLLILLIVQSHSYTSHIIHTVFVLTYYQCTTSVFDTKKNNYFDTSTNRRTSYNHKSIVFQQKTNTHILAPVHTHILKQITYIHINHIYLLSTSRDFQSPLHHHSLLICVTSDKLLPILSTHHHSSPTQRQTPRSQPSHHPTPRPCRCPCHFSRPCPRHGPRSCPHPCHPAYGCSGTTLSATAAVTTDSTAASAASAAVATCPCCSVVLRHRSLQPAQPLQLRERQGERGEKRERRRGRKR